MRKHNEFWCTHVGQEIPVLVYALLMCKLVIMLRVYLTDGRMDATKCIISPASWSIKMIAPNKVTLIRKVNA